jgi:hypothetical protein
MLRFQAEILDDLEGVRTANENRLRQLTRSAEDADGEVRGFGMTEEDPAVAQLAALVSSLGQLEHAAVLDLQRAVRKHPMGPWIKAQRGIGEKQGARLLAAIGDPWWNDLHDRPRTVSELWAYCGYHTIKLPTGRGATDTQTTLASRSTLPGGQSPMDAQKHLATGIQLPSGQATTDTHTAGAGGAILPGSQSGSDTQSTSAAGIQLPSGHPTFGAQPSTAGGAYHVAAKRAKGQRANWSATAKMRAYLIAESVVKSGGPWREVYDKRKAATDGRLHVVACVRCGPSGKPAQPGSAWSAGHRHADALRITAKEILKGMWREARRLHELP